MAKKPFPSKKAPVKSRQEGASKSAETVKQSTAASKPKPENAADNAEVSATTKRTVADRTQKTSEPAAKKRPIAEMQNKASLGSKALTERTATEKAAAEQAAAEQAAA